MRDGINLSASTWLPEKSHLPVPGILMLTPYIADESHVYGKYFASNGYAFVCADCRGRGNSEGEFYPLEQDGPDGAELVEWISEKDWCDGRVGMMGGSYRGMVQWQTLMHKPKSLKTIVPTASVGPGIDYPQPKNIFYSFAARWLAYVGGRTGNAEIFTDDAFWQEKFLQLQRERMPMTDLAELCGITPNILNRWLSHPVFDDYWRAMMPSTEDYESFDIPTFTITGHFDDDQPGAMTYYKQHMKYGSESGRSKHYLMIGPWDHPGTRNPQKKLSNMTFDDVSLIDMKKLHLDWFNHVFRGEEMPGILKDRVSLYVMGDEKWVWAENLDRISNDTLRLYINSEFGRANDVFQSGKLLPEIEGGESSDSFMYNPGEIISSEKYASDKPVYPVDQNAHFSNGVLIYHSQIFDWELIISGYLKFIIYLEMNAPDADFYVNVYEIRNNGETYFLGGDILRAKYRDSLVKEEYVNPGDINKYEFDNFFLFSRKIFQGSRLRLIFGCLNHPEYEKNYCTGTVSHIEDGNELKEVRVKVYHGEKYPSCLELPVLV